MLNRLRTTLAWIRGKNRKPSNIQIGKKSLGRTVPVFVIAEIGINHNGSMDIAKRLIDAAADAGAQAVKFQKRTVPVVYTAEELAKDRKVDRSVLENAIIRGVLPKDAVKRLKDSNFENSTNGDLKWALEFTESEYRELFDYANRKGLEAFASPWDEGSVDILEKLGVPAYKIASASLTDDALLKKIRSTNKPVILSTGMSTMQEVKHAVDILGTKDLALLHTVSTYPSEYRHLNLKLIARLRQEFPTVLIGYSGHEKGIGTTVAAAAIGARVIERHLTLDKTMYGSDQAASLEPDEFKQMITDIRSMEEAFGDGFKRVIDEEIPIAAKLRRKPANV